MTGKAALLCGIVMITSACDSGLRAKAPVPPSAPPPADPPPLVLAQTIAELPPANPVPPESFPPTVPADVAPAAAPVQPVIQSQRRIPAPLRSEPPKPRPPELPAPAAVPSVPGEPATTLQSGADLTKSTALIETQLRDIRQRLQPYSGSRDVGTRSAAARIANFLRLGDKALQRGELRQAEAMADRARTLLRELTR